MTTPAPPDLTISAVPGDDVVLVWIDRSTTESSFVVQRRSGGARFTTVDELDTNDIAGVSGSYTWTDESAVADACYRVLATDGEQAGASVERCRSTLPIVDNRGIGVVAPRPPTVALEQVTAGNVAISWTDASTTETEFVVQRRDLTGHFHDVSRTRSPDPMGTGRKGRWTDGSDSTTLQCYRVLASDGEFSGASEEVCVVRPDPAGPVPTTSDLEWDLEDGLPGRLSGLENSAARGWLSADTGVSPARMFWARTPVRSITVTRELPFGETRLRTRESVALHVAGSGWLTSQTIENGSFSDEPVYEWQFVGADPHALLGVGTPVALWNETREDFVVCCASDVRAGLLFSSDEWRDVESEVDLELPA